MYDITKLTIEEFNTKIRKANERLNAEKTRLGVSDTNLEDLGALMGDLVTPDTWLHTWELYAGGEATCTSNVRKGISSLRTRIENKLSSIYNDIPASIWNDDDRSTFGRTTGAKDAPSKPGVIADNCCATAVAMGGGIMKISCKTATDQSRASLAKDSNGVQIAYIVVDQPTKDGVPDPNTVKRQTITSPEQCTHKEFFMEATFRLELGPANAGRNIQFFVRYYNARYPGNAGPWSDMNSKNIA